MCLPATVLLTASEVIDRVLAVAAGNLIMMSDVRTAIDFGIVPADNSSDPVRETLSRLIERSLVLAEVDRYAPPEPDADAVDRALDGVKRHFPSPQAYRDALVRDGIDEKHLRETMREELRIQAYLDQRFTVAPPTVKDLTRYYREHPDDFKRGAVTAPFAGVRAEVLQAVSRERRRSLVDEWLSGLRRRAEVIDLYRQ